MFFKATYCLGLCYINYCSINFIYYPIWNKSIIFSEHNGEAAAAAAEQIHHNISDYNDPLEWRHLGMNTPVSSLPADPQAYEPPVSLWSLVVQYAPGHEQDEMKNILGESLVEQSLELHQEVLYQPEKIFLSQTFNVHVCAYFRPMCKIDLKRAIGSSQPSVFNNYSRALLMTRTEVRC